MKNILKAYIAFIVYEQTFKNKNFTNANIKIMKLKLFFSLFLSLFILSFSACNKKDKETTATRLQHKWTVLSIVEHDHINGEDETDTTPGEAGDYIEFQSNGQATFYLDGETQNVAYSLQSDNKILFGGATFDIKSLTDNSLILYSKEQDGADYYEITINLSR